MEHKAKFWKPAALALVPGTGLSGATAALCQYTDFSSRLASLDQFLNANLFIDLMAVAIGGGALLQVVAQQVRMEGRQKHDALHNLKQYDEAYEAIQRSEAESSDIASGASFFMCSFFGSLLGLMSSIALDAAFKEEEQSISLKELASQQLAGSGWEHSVAMTEVITSGAFLGATVWLMAQGFMYASKAFAVTHPSKFRNKSSNM